MEIGIALTVVFVVLKLVGVVDWSWLWVLSPLWIGAAIIGIIFAIFGAGFLFLFKKLRRFTKQYADNFNDRSSTRQDTTYHRLK